MLKPLLEEMIAVDSELVRLEFEGAPLPKLAAPAPKAQLRTLEQLLKKPLPASYRAFLEVTNGLEAMNLLPADAHRKAWVKRRLADIDELFFERDDAQNPMTAWGALPVMLDEDSRTYAVLDPRNMQFVVFDSNKEVARFKDFTAFLQSELATLKSLLAKARKITPQQTREAKMDIVAVRRAIVDSLTGRSVALPLRLQKKWSLHVVDAIRSAASAEVARDAVAGFKQAKWPARAWASVVNNLKRSPAQLAYAAKNNSPLENAIGLELFELLFTEAALAESDRSRWVEATGCAVAFAHVLRDGGRARRWAAFTKAH